jgi:hypothetical protein
LRRLLKLSVEAVEEQQTHSGPLQPEASEPEGASR